MPTSPAVIPEAVIPEDMIRAIRSQQYNPGNVVWATGREEDKVATVRQSITALYEESQKSAAEGAAMMAVINSSAALDAPADGGLAQVRPFAAPEPASIVARFEELRRLAEAEAAHADDQQPDHDQPDHNRPEDDPYDERPFVEGPFDEGSVDTDENIPMAGVATMDSIQTAMDSAASESRPQHVVSTPVETAEPDDLTLPQEPPAPASGGGGDLEIGDIQELVRQAWEDEAGIRPASSATSAPSSQPSSTPPSSAATQPQQPATKDQPAIEEQTAANDQPATNDQAAPAPTDIEMAMEEIAAAVVQSGDNAARIDVEALKAEIIAAMRNEMKALVEADLTSAVRSAVAAAVGEAVTTALAKMNASAATPVAHSGAEVAGTDSKAKPTAKKAATKKSAGKSAGKTAAAKKSASRTTKKAGGKAAVVKKLRADPTPDPDEV